MTVLVHTAHPDPDDASDGFGIRAAPIILIA